MDEPTGRPSFKPVARDDGPTVGTCCGVSETLPGDDR